MAPRNDPPAAEAEPSFEDALNRLETIVEELEGGGLSLEQSLRHYEEGMKLSKRLGRTLDEAEKTIERLIETSGDDAAPPAAATAERRGKPATRPIELDLESGKGGDSELPF